MRRAGGIEGLNDHLGGTDVAVETNDEVLDGITGAGAEEDFAFGIDRGAVGAAVAFTDERPSFAGEENLAKHLVLRLSRLHRLWPILPEKPHRIREDRGRVFAGVAAVAPGVIDF